MPINHEPIKDRSKSVPAFLPEHPRYNFDDIIISDELREKLANALAYEKYKDLIYETWQLKTVLKVKRGMAINLFGPSGTGKTMVAHAIANELGLELLSVNYADIESKYVGETSKNLESLFKYAEENNYLILFDEADALLSQRVTMMNSATDVSVNQTRNVLLKILDTFTKPIVFTTNFISNYDKAFIRRIPYQIEFSMPDKNIRKELWNHYLLDTLPLNENRSSFLEEISNYENITGSDIANIILELAIELARGIISSLSVDYIHNKIMHLQKLKDEVNGLHVESHKIPKEEAEKLLKKELP